MIIQPCCDFSSLIIFSRPVNVIEQSIFTSVVETPLELLTAVIECRSYVHGADDCLLDFSVFLLVLNEI